MSESTTTEPAFAPDLASALAQMSRLLLTVPSTEAVIDLTTALAMQTLPGTLGAGVTLITAEGRRTRAASNPLVKAADQLQYDAGDGPCLTAWREGRPVRIDDLAIETRWPAWTRDVAFLGIRSIVSAPLTSAGRSLGAIKVYADRPAVYTETSAQILMLFADQAAVLLATLEAVADVQRITGRLPAILDERDTIEQAVGILLARRAADAPTAARVLRSRAQRAGTSLAEFARGLIDATVMHSDPLSP